MDAFSYAQVLWDYLCLHQTPEKADCIVGFGCYNEDIPRRCAQLYREGFAPYVLFTGGLCFLAKRRSVIFCARPGIPPGPPWRG